MGKLTDRQKKNIIRLWAECGNYSAVAAKYGVSDTTIRRIVASDPKALKKVEDKKRENMQSVLAKMDEQRTAVCAAMDRLLDELTNGGCVEKSNAQQVAVALGVLIDKYGGKELANTAESGGGGVIEIPAVIDEEKQGENRN